MGGSINKLIDLAIKNAKPGKSPRRFADGGGLFLEIRPNGAKYWRLAYRFDKKQKLLALGVYPLVSAPEAREGARIAREHLAAGRDPGLLRKSAVVCLTQLLLCVGMLKHPLWIKPRGTYNLDTLIRQMFVTIYTYGVAGTKGGILLRGFTIKLQFLFLPAD